MNELSRSNAANYSQKTSSSVIDSSPEQAVGVFSIKNKIFYTLGGVFVFLSVLITPSFAQVEVDQASPTAQESAAPAGQIDQNSPEPGVGGGPGTQDDGFNLWWLLPLLAIPLLYYLWRNANEEPRGEKR